MLSTLITSSIQYGTVSRSLPRVGYLKGIDIWMLGCLGLIFFGMLVYSILAYIMWNSDNGTTDLKICGKSVDPKKIMSIIDKIAKVLYLVLFATFIGVYFVFFVAAKENVAGVL